MSFEGWETADRAVAVIGVGAVLPDALGATRFWQNVVDARYSITEVSPDRWDPADYYHPDPKAPGRTYSKIGGWVRDFTFDSLRYRIPPRVADSMDDAQKWALAATREALTDAGHPDRPLNLSRTATIVGNAMGGELHYHTVLGVTVPPAVRHALAASPSFANLDEGLRHAVEREMNESVAKLFPSITEDSMPGELANVVAGRIANVFDLHGPNYICDAACASSLAALDAAIEGLVSRHFDVAVCGGIDRNMSPGTFVKFAKIGALSADGSRPFAKGANGFVMGEGAAIYILKRLADAERDGDRIYAVIRSVGGSSDGKGKGITAPNPEGQKRAMIRAYERAGFPPSTIQLIEAHGTSTTVGDYVEVSTLNEVFRGFDLPKRSIALGSVKSQIGHLKAGAGAAGMLKAIQALHHKILPPSAQFHAPNPEIRFEDGPLVVNTEARPWEAPSNGIRRASVSSFGFGGTNFHVVLEEHVPGMLTSRRPQIQVPSGVGSPSASSSAAAASHESTDPPMLRGLVLVSGENLSDLRVKLTALAADASRGVVPPKQLPSAHEMRAGERIAIDFGDAVELEQRAGKAIDAIDDDRPAAWRLLRGKGVFRGREAPGKVAFMFPGQGSQYVNMLRELRDVSSTVRRVFDEADHVMRDRLDGRTLTQLIYVADQDPAKLEEAEAALRQTTVTQPAMLATDIALARLLEDFAIHPDMVIGHSLGEYAALVSAGVMPFADALVAVSARAKEMASVSLADSGKMAGVIGPYEKIEKVLAQVNGYVVAANRNSKKQTVIAGATTAVEEASERLRDAGLRVIALNVSHAFHSDIVAPASGPLRQVIERLDIRPPRLPVVANVDGKLYPMHPGARPEVIDRLARQISAPVLFVQGLETLYEQGVRVFVEVGPKKVLASFAEENLGDHGDVVALATNNPKAGPEASFGAALAYLYSIGRGRPRTEPPTPAAQHLSAPSARRVPEVVSTPAVAASAPVATPVPAAISRDEVLYRDLGKLFAGFLDQGMQLMRQGGASSLPQPAATPAASAPADGSVVVSGVGIGLPGQQHALFDDENFQRMLRGELMIDRIPDHQQDRMVDKNVVRLIKSENAGPRLDRISGREQVLKLAGRRGSFDLARDFGVAEERASAYDITTEMAIGAGLEALRDAGIPLVRRYRKTSRGTYLPDRWMLPEPLADETGVIFASAFPGYNRFAELLGEYHQHNTAASRVAALEKARGVLPAGVDTSGIDRMIEEEKQGIKASDYLFERKFLFEVLAMGHSQFAELIGARGPNTQVNAACSSTTLAVALAQDWIRGGRCARVLVIAADDVTSDTMLEWIGAGFLATGAATTESEVARAALPFDKRRHGMILGMGACALVVESEDAMRERGMRGIAEVLATEAANSAFHGTRLDVQHICSVMKRTVDSVEARHGLRRDQMAGRTVFISHETYTPARGGSASAEVHALRETFGDAASSIVIANTKGYTGHPMGVGLEDALAVKILAHRMVPPIPNFKEVDPELGELNLSKGGSYPIDFALRFSAGFGSQLAITLYRRLCGPEERYSDTPRYHAWLGQMSGYPAPATEIAQRTLRIRDEGVPMETPRPTAWTFGSTPVARAETLGALGAHLAAPSVRPPSVLPAARAATPIPPPPAAVPQPVQPKNDLAARVLLIVANKTGYPVDMLALDLDLEADLGIDTVKQAEVFAEIRKEFNLPRRDDLKLREYPTLAHVIGYVEAGRPELASAAQPVHPAAPVSAAPQAPAAGGVDDKVLRIVADKTGYPVDMLALDLDLEADLGIDTVKQAEVFAEIRKEFNLPRRDDLKLREYPTLAHVIQYVKDGRPELAQTPLQTAPAPVVAAPAARRPAATGGDEISVKVLQIVADKTGYPEDMLALDLDLEADLGIDTVKQAEVFAELRSHFGFPRRDDLKLRDYPTLERVIGYVRDNLPKSLLPEPAPAAAPAPQPMGAPGSDEVMSAVLQIVADKTGYPTDMLALDLDLEADLGVDTVKQAEVFAVVRDRFNIPRMNELKLRDYPTLGHVVEFVRSNRPDLAAVAEPSQQRPAADVEDEDESGGSSLQQLVPTPMLRPAIAQCKPTACSIGAGSRVVLVADEGGVAAELESLLSARSAQVLVLGAGEPQMTERVLAWAAGCPIDGLFFLPALDAGPAMDELSPEDFGALLDRTIRSLYGLARGFLEHLGRPGAFLLTGTRMGGMLGYGSRPAVAPWGGAVSGFTKAFGREALGTLAKVVDFESGATAAFVATSLLAEVERDPAPLEVGYAGIDRIGITLIEQEKVAADATSWTDATVFLITGAGGGITSAITADLARASGGVFYLLDLPPNPDRTNPDLARIRNDREGLKRDLVTRLQEQSSERVTPAVVERELFRIERDAATASAIAAVEQAGGRPIYISCNVTDPAAVKAAVDTILAEHPGIDVIVHAAGLERSRPLASKGPEEFNLIFDVKALGLYNLLAATRGAKVGNVLCFSSVAGRFGNAGQVDYSAANDFLCKVMSSLGQLRPDTRALAVDWTAWASIGMATRGSIPEIMKRAGIEMLDPAKAIPVVRRQLQSGGHGEIVVAGTLGILVEPRDVDGGVEPTTAATHARSHNAPFALRVVRADPYEGVVLDAVLDPAEPYLNDHRIEGMAVLPGVMGLEIFAQSVGLLAPGRQVVGARDIRFEAPLKCYRNEARTAHVTVRILDDGEALRAVCTLWTTFQVKGSSAPAEIKRHFSADLVLADDALEPASRPLEGPKGQGGSVDREQLYRAYFHTESFRVLQRTDVASDGKALLGSLAPGLPPFFKEHSFPTASAPRLLELCFQTAGVIEIGSTRRLGLPSSIQELRIHNGHREAEAVARVQVRERAEGLTFDAEVCDAAGTLVLEVLGYRTSALPSSIPDEIWTPLGDGIRGLDA